MRFADNTQGTLLELGQPNAQVSGIGCMSAKSLLRRCMHLFPDRCGGLRITDTVYRADEIVRDE